MDQRIKGHFKKRDAILFKLFENIELKPLTKTDDYFVFLCESIISQQLSVKAADTIFARFAALFPDQKITPQQTLKLSDDEIRKAGLSYTKIGYIKDLARHFIGDKLPKLFEDHHTEDEIIETLTRVKGIGRWTAEMFLMSALGRPDVFSYGDLGLRRAIQKLYKLKNEPSKEEAEKIALKWSPYRTYACKILWKSLALSPSEPDVSKNTQRKRRK